jgi:hypothetical protein
MNYLFSNCEIIGFMEVSNIEIKASVLSTSPISSTLQYLSRTFLVNSVTVSLRFSTSFVFLSVQKLLLLHGFHIPQSRFLQTFPETYSIHQQLIILCFHTYVHGRYACMEASIDFEINSDSQAKLDLAHPFLSQAYPLQHKPL